METKKVLRLLPFLILTVISLCVAAGWAPPNKPFSIDTSMSWQSVGTSMQKTEHFKATTLVFILAWLAMGRQRLFISCALTMLICFAWECVEAMAIGHTGRLSDLAPDLTAALLSLLFCLLLRSLIISSPVGART